MKIAAIGEKDFIEGFKGMGFSVFPVTDTKKAEKELDSLQKEGYSLVYITDTIAKDILDKIDEISKNTNMNISIIPGREGKSKIELERLKKTVIRAVGADVLEK